jgi:hypothetical protein
MAQNFSNRGQIVQTVLAVVALLFVGLTAYAAHLGTVPAFLWILLFSAAIASTVVAILNLWVGWGRSGTVPTENTETSTSPATKPNSGGTQSMSPPLQPILTVKIAFAYLPKSPLENGWTVGYRSEDAHPSFSAIRAMSENTLLMVVGERFAMDHEIPRNAQFSRRIAFSVIYHANTMLFLQFRLKAEDGRTTDLWVKIEPGTLPAGRTPDYPTEYTIRVQGSPQPGGWMLMDLSLPAIIEKTWLQEGWHYEAVVKIRLRGSIGISPISLFA